MATNKLMEEEGIFRSLREKYGSIDAAVAAKAEGWAGAGAEASITDESSLREALDGPQHDQIIAILIGMAKAPTPGSVGPDIHGNTLRSRTETVDGNETITIHAEKSQDIEVENDETHAVGHDRARLRFWGDDNGDIPFDHRADLGESNLLGLQNGMQHENLRVALGDQNADGAFAGSLDDEEPFQFQKISGDWNSDGNDTIGFGDADGDADVDGSDFL